MRVITAFTTASSVLKNFLCLLAIFAFAKPAYAQSFRQALLEMSVTNILVLASYTVAIVVVVYYLFRVRYLNKKKNKAE